MADDVVEQDEVKVYRREDPEELETTSQSSSDLAETKKEAVLETELESGGRTVGNDNITGSTPQFTTMMPLNTGNPFLMGMAAAALSPNFMMPFIQVPQAGQAAAASYFRPPSSPAAQMMSSLPFMPMGALSPSYNMYSQMMMNCGPGSPIHQLTMRMNAAVQAHQAANIRMMHPLSQMNHMQVPSVSTMGRAGRGDDEMRGVKSGKIKKEDHIKKPLNAFMWYMKVMRKTLKQEEGYSDKQSADLNKELGQRWKDLPEEEKKEFYKMARDQQEEHKAKYPNWSAKENYRIHNRKKRTREKMPDGAQIKKCRAKYGLEKKDSWCQGCLRKKKCTNAYDTDEGNSTGRSDRGSTNSTPHTSSSHGPSPMSLQSPTHSDSESDEFDNDDEDVDSTLVMQDINEAALQHRCIDDANL